MSNIEDAIVANENVNGPKFALIIDDHVKHILRHLLYFYKPGMLIHVYHHIKLFAKSKKLGIGHISTENVIAMQRKNNG